MKDIGGRPQWELHFDEKGKVTGATTVGDILTGLADRGVENLFVFSHGWNNSEADARRLFAGMFPLIGAQARERGGGMAAGIGYLGIFWPSIWFPDEEGDPSSAPAPGTVSASLSGPDIARSIGRGFADDEATQKAVARLGKLIEDGEQALELGGADADQRARAAEFKTLLPALVPNLPAAQEDSGEAQLLTGTGDPVAEFAALSDVMGGGPGDSDAQGIGDIFRKVWHGAKEALRIASYTEMKGRAGVIGKVGLAPFLKGVTQAGGVRVHLIGHSFGARLVAFSLSGLSAAESPVRSLTLVQAAFSHWTFTETQPFDDPGVLSEFADRVHGPLVATFSSHDLAVGAWYPRASFLSRQDNQADADFTRRWGGIGADGFQDATPALAAQVMAGVGTDYGLTAGSFASVDASGIIENEGQSKFSGAHSDINHPEVAWLTVAGAMVGAN